MGKFILNFKIFSVIITCNRTLSMCFEKISVIHFVDAFQTNQCGSSSGMVKVCALYKYQN